MKIKTFVVLLVASLLPLVLSKTKWYSKNQINSLSKARCDLACYQKEKSKAKLQQCRTQCRAEEKKPGTCPKNDSPKWEAACVEACNTDSQCDETQKCCHHSCGSTCSEPVDLETLPGLPAIPVIEEIKEKRKAKVLIIWSDGVGDIAREVPGKILYILEEQHHVGPKYEEMRLKDWTLLLRTNRTKVSLRDTLKPGRWYRFRVASVSSSGTRGFSEPSKPFTLRRGPRPPSKPKKLKVRQIGTDGNGTVTVKLEWKEPKSDLPILRYKVFWSRRARGVGGDLDSVLVNHLYVPKSYTFIELKNLYPNSMYFFQVQTISQFGLGKLRSDKAEIFFNTTDSDAPEMLQKNEIRELRLNKIIWYNHNLKARISWQPVENHHVKGKPTWDTPKKDRYYIHWSTIKCIDHKKEPKDLSAVTEQTEFEIYELEYNCSYLVNVNHTPNQKNADAKIIIKVPSCDYFKRKVNVTSVTCEDK